MPRIYLGLGSNIEPEANLRLGVRELRRRFGPLTLSPTYKSRSVGFDGEDFLNLVAAFDGEHSPAEIVEQLEEIHTLAGRVRENERFLSRTLDIDLLLVGDLVTDGPPTRLPRADVLECAFVLKPLVDIAPDLVHPVSRKTMEEHWNAFDREGQPLEDYRLELD